jgi:hypothetical protein
MAKFFEFRSHWLTGPGLTDLLVKRFLSGEAVAEPGRGPDVPFALFTTKNEDQQNSSTKSPKNRSENS